MSHGSEPVSKIGRILWLVVVALVIILAAAWLIAGGVGKIETAAKNFPFPWSLSGFGNLEGGGGITLPWGVPIPQGPDISGITSGNSGGTSQAQNFGSTSSYGAGTVTLSAEGASASNPQAEYIVIQNNGNATIDITGWSLQSALSAARAYLPRGASFFQMGALNQQDDIELAPGGVAIVTTGTSPVGTSFRENECSGYLGQLQQYAPPIQTQCPSPQSAAAQAAQYGQSCAQFVSSLPSCTFPANLPQGISQSCATYAQTNFSYNGCVAQFQNDPSFPSSTWRVYLDASRELWGNTHDTIRLLDTQGQVVAVTSY